MRSRTYLVDLDKKNYQVANYKQYDNNIEYSIHLVENGMDVSLAGCTVFALFRRKDGKAFQKTCTIKDSVITTLLDNNILELDGIVKSEFRIYKGDVIVTTFSITINVEDSINAGDAIDSVPGADLIGTIMDLQKEIEDARDGKGSLKEKLDEIENNITNHTHPYAGSDTHGGSANSAKKLVTPRKINGTDFDGTQNITTEKWGKTRTVTIGNSPKQVDGSADVTWTLGEIGATPINHNHSVGDVDLKGYNKGNQNGALDPNDSLNDALSKLENNIQTAGQGNFLPVAGGNMFGYINFANTLGLANTNKKFLRTENLETILSSANGGGTIYLRPNGDLDQIGQVKIESNGNVTADTFVGDLQGNATTATRLQTTREIRLQGDVTGTANFNGSANAVITSTLANVARNNTTSNQSPNFGTTFTAIDRVTTDTKGRITGVNTKTVTLPTPAQATDTNVTNTLNTTTRAYITGTTSNTTNTGTQIFDNNVYLDTTAGHLTATQFNGRLNGNATTSTTLQNARTLTIGNTGKTFNGSQNVTWNLDEIGASPKIHNHSSNNINALTGYNKGNNNGALTTNDSLNTALAKLENNIENAKNSSLPTTGGNVTGNITAPSFTGALNGNATTATRLQNAREINGTLFDGTQNITTAKWGTVRNLTIGNATKSIDGSQNITFTLQEIGAGAGGGITSITTNGQTYNAVGNNITLPNHLLLTGGTVTGATNFNQGINCQAVSVFTGIRSEGINPATGFSYWSISAQGNAAFNNLQTSGETLFQGQVTTHKKMRGMAVDGSEAWSIERDGNASFESLRVRTTGSFFGIQNTNNPATWSINDIGDGKLNKLDVVNDGTFRAIRNNQAQPTWSIDSNGHSEFNDITAKGVIYGKNRILLNNGTIYLPQGGGNIVADHLRIGGGFMACKDDGTMHFLTSGGNPTNLYGAGFIQGSDIKLKENIRYIDAPKKTSKDIKDDTITKDELFNFIKNLKVCEYNYIESENDKIGFIANDVVGDKVGDKIVLEDGGVLSYDTSNMLFTAIGALQEEIEKREALENRLKLIEEKLGI